MKHSKYAASLIFGLIASLFGGTAANAATVYDHSDYRGESFTTVWAPSVGSLNDRISSFRTGGVKHCFYEDINFTGRSFPTANDHRNLKHVWANRGAYQTWNDRISSFIKC